MIKPGGASPVNLAMALQPKVGTLPAQRQFIPPAPTAPAQPSLGVQLVQAQKPYYQYTAPAVAAPRAQPSNATTKAQFQQKMRDDPYGIYWGNS